VKASSFRKIERWAKFIRDIGVIVGVPVLIIIGSKFYGQQVAALKTHTETLQAQNNFLRETQFDRALALIKSQKELYEIDRKSLEKELASLKQDSEQYHALQRQLDIVKTVERANTQALHVVKSLSNTHPSSNPFGMPPPTTVEEYQAQKQKIYEELVKDMNQQYDQQEKDLKEALSRTKDMDGNRTPAGTPHQNR
jgi:hypothetical protein